MTRMFAALFGFLMIFGFMGFGITNPAFAMTCPEEGVCSDPLYRMVIGTSCPMSYTEISRATRCDPTRGTCSGFVCIVGAPGTPPEPVARLCKQNGFRVYLTNMPAGSTFSFQMSASGNFMVDWGDGQPAQVINKTNTTNETFTSGTYATAGNRTVVIRGLATGYNEVVNTAAIRFNNNQSQITQISGDLGQIFPILSAGLAGTPRFFATFMDTNITSIPENLFAGISGLAAQSMFGGTFANTNITSIPENLFAGISCPCPSASHIFWDTFRGTNITSIPENLFASISGPPVDLMFHSTFADTNITSIPENLFAGISGPPAQGMFGSTFRDTNITSIPENLFAGISGPSAASMFSNTFASTNITSIPANLFAGISGAPVFQKFFGTFANTSITSIPENLFAGISGPPADGMFADTFANTNITSIPENLFAGISGPPAERMFFRTFYNATSLTGPSARINGQFLYHIWPDATTTHVEGMYRNATGLSDWGSIPAAWR